MVFYRALSPSTPLHVVLPFMRGKQLLFFAEQQDLQQLIAAVEATTLCQYYEAGSFETSSIPSYTSLLDIPTLGTVPFGAMTLATRILLLPAGTTLATRAVTQRTGSVRYLVDQLANPQSLVLTLGGAFQSGVLVASGIGTLAKDVVSMTLYGAWVKRIKQLQRVSDTYVAPHAYRRLQAGWRLTTNANLPSEYDLPTPA